jgi:putative FmdB family regulatory protein
VIKIPIYEFQCKKCGYIFEEVILSKVSKIGTICPNCSYIATKIISSSNFVIKGYSAANNYSKKDNKNKEG